MSGIFKNVSKGTQNLSSTIKKSGLVNIKINQKNEENKQNSSNPEFAYKKNPRILFYKYKKNFLKEGIIIYKALTYTNNKYLNYHFFEKWKEFFYLNVLITSFFNWKLGIMLYLPLRYYKKEISSFSKNKKKNDFDIIFVRKLYMDNSESFSILSDLDIWEKFLIRDNEVIMDNFFLHDFKMDINTYENVLKDHLFIRNNKIIFAFSLNSIIFNKELFGHLINGRIVKIVDFKLNPNMRIAKNYLNDEKNNEDNSKIFNEKDFYTEDARFHILNKKV